MQQRVKNRLITICIVISLVAMGVSLLLYAMRDNIVFFYAPSELSAHHLSKEIRVGGLVKLGSIEHMTIDRIKFTITDSEKDLIIYYQGITPLLFREGQGIVAQGRLSGDGFVASKLLAKHDENYKPPVMKNSSN